MKRGFATLLFAAIATPAMAQFTPPLGAGAEVAGPRTEMLNLGSTHLSGHEAWKREWLAPLNARLAAWKPGIVTIERLSGAQCDMMRATPEKFGGIFDHYCADDSGFQRALGMTQAQAEVEADKMLATWPASPAPAQRRRLAMLFLAAGDRPSALVQWLRLPGPERREDDGLTAAALDVFDRASKRMNENYEIGSEVAAASGLERVYSVDDHTSDVLGDAYPQGFDAWQMARFERLSAAPLLQAHEAKAKTVTDGAALLAFYRDMNAPGAQDAQVQSDFGGAFADAAPERFGRYYGGWWETRNLRMLANIREAITVRPGARVLNIVGASHKPWYDQWARQMADVVVVDAHAVLSD